MKTRELYNLGVPKGTMSKAFEAIVRARKQGIKAAEIRDTIKAVVADPNVYISNDIFGSFAIALTGHNASKYVPRKTSAPYKMWGSDFEHESIKQMESALELPISVRGALMPDAHLGYGLPIGGVLATDNAVIPYAVGVDIACRMRLSVLDAPVKLLESDRERLKNAIGRETAFGPGCTFQKKRRHDVMDEDWSISPAIRKDLAWSQLGTSGGGNHFVEFGEFTIQGDDILPPGTYLALLSHSGSRRVGMDVANHYVKVAKDKHQDLPPHLKNLAWLDMDSAEGQEYWAAMELMGKYAAANHYLIHKHICKNLGFKAVLEVENHHNFAWRERYDGRNVIVHRKGATPAGLGILGIIPGSMATPGYLVRGKGNAESLNSASHGAGRKMSRKKAKESFCWSHVKAFLAEKKVELLGAGLDEVPMAYKDIEAVMDAQSDLVEIIGSFMPRMVKMAGRENG